MTQTINQKVWEEFDIKIKNLSKRSKGGVISLKSSSSKEPGQFMLDVVNAGVRISNVFKEYNIDKCPICEDYEITLWDNTGTFCCQDNKCKFRGNLVDFFVFMEELE
jgi:hypothetical protein